MIHKGVSGTPAMLAACAIVAISAIPSAAASCDIAPAKKQTIAAFLCGNMSAKAEARFSGDGCAAKAAQRRSADDAALIQMAALCGEKAYADRLQAFVVKSAKFVDTLSACMPQPINYSKMTEDALAQPVTKGIPCSDAMHELINMKKAEFEKSPASADPDKVVSAFFDKLGISVDKAGNLRDK